MRESAEVRALGAESADPDPRYTAGVIVIFKRYLPCMLAGLLASIGVASAIREARWEARAGVAIPFGSIAYNELRMEAVKSSLPRSGVIGYVTDLDMTRD